MRPLDIRAPGEDSQSSSRTGKEKKGVKNSRRKEGGQSERTRPKGGKKIRKGQWGGAGKVSLQEDHGKREGETEGRG